MQADHGSTSIGIQRFLFYYLLKYLIYLFNIIFRRRRPQRVFMIELKGIFQTYQGPTGPVEALRGVDLQIKPGEVFGIIGRSGAAKARWCVSSTC